MKKDQIKHRVNSYLKEFNENSGTFKSCEIIFNYISFLKSEPYLQELLSGIFDYAEKQIELTKKIIKDNSKEVKKLDNFTFNPKDISNVSDIPIFKKELSRYSEAVKSNENIPATFALAIFMVPLLFITNAFKDIKEKQKEKDDKEVKRLIEILKDESLSITYLSVKNEQAKTATSDKLYAEYMKVINKYIVDIIDSEAFLDKNEMKATLSFDKEKSILNIYGELVSIRRQKDMSYEHDILEYLFDKDNIYEEVDFRDIAENKLGVIDYNNIKDSDRIRRACDRINKKVKKKTKDKITKFIDFQSGKAGWCQINQKQL
jgi:hypothetical protein